MPDKSVITLATFFPGCQNVHLVKDVGMIPYVLKRDLGFESYIITYENDRYSHLDGTVKGLRMLFLKRGFMSHIPHIGFLTL